MNFNILLSYFFIIIKTNAVSTYNDSGLHCVTVITVL